MFQQLAKLFALLLPAFWIATDRKTVSIRDIIVREANKVVGLDASEPGMREDFKKLLGIPPVGGFWDLDRPFHVDAEGRTQGLSTCGLVARGIQVYAGIPWPAWSKPYVPGSVFADMIGFAQKHGAWRTSGLPEYGDIFVIGRGYRTHMATAINIDGSEVLSVDGGQVNPKTGLQCIKQVSRDWRVQEVVGIIDSERIAQVLK